MIITIIVSYITAFNFMDSRTATNLMDVFNPKKMEKWMAVPSLTHEALPV